MANIGDVLRNSGVNRIGILISGLAVISALAGAVSILISASGDKRRQSEDAFMRHLADQRDVTELAKQVAQLKSEADKNVIALDSMSLALKSQDFTRAAFKGLGMRPEERRELTSMEETQKQLVDRMSTLEAALSDTPEKAIALPLLKQQLSDTQERFKSDIEETHSEFGRLYTVVQWALGLIITIILGLGGLLIAKAREASPAAAVVRGDAPAISKESLSSRIESGP